MKMVFENKKITGILGVLPEQVYSFDDEIHNYSFSVKQTKRLKNIMGFDKHRLAKPSSSASDFCVYGLNYLLDKELIKQEEIGAIVVVSVSPDYFLPNISSIIHGKCQLNEEVICIDIPQACNGYLYGIMQACLLLEHLQDKKVVLFNSDVLSHKVSKRDRSNYPLTGDATTITILENHNDYGNVSLELYSDGGNREALIIPAGGFAMPCSDVTSVEEMQEDGNIRSLEQLRMNGTAVFDFVTDCVPPLFHKVLEECNVRKEDIDYFLFHQPNKFLLSKLIDELDIPGEKTFMNIVENFGNPHSASIPLNVVYNLRNQLMNGRYQCCLAAFGAGLTAGVCMLDLGDFDFCEMIETSF